MTNSKTIFKNAVVIGGISMALAQSARADLDLIQNGQFTALTLINPQPGYPASLSSGGQLDYNINATGWNVSGGGSGSYSFVFSPSAVASGANGYYGNLSLWTAGNGGVGNVTPPPLGGNILASDGAFQLAPIQQTITGLTPGQKYDVSFYYAGAQQYGFTSPTSEAWYVSLGNGAVQETPVLDNVSHGFTGWKKETIALTADNSSDVLTFLAYGTPTGVPPFTLLSDVSLVAAPEPSALVGGGLVVLAFGLGSLRMFRKQKQA